MNCPNCGGLLDLDKRECKFCDSVFTEDELFKLKSYKTKDTESNAMSCEADSKKTLTERKQEELEKERKSKEKTNTDSNDVVVGAAVMGLFGGFFGLRGLFYNLKRTVCLILLLALEVGFVFLMISPKIAEILVNGLQGFVTVNMIILLNALLSGIICRIGLVRAGTPIVAIINFLAVVWVFVYPMIMSNFESQTPQSVTILAVVEMTVLVLSVVLSHLISKRHY